MKKTPCQCGCGREEYPNRMTLVRSQWGQGAISRPGLIGWWVTKDCREAFEAELIRTHAAEVVVRENANAGIFRRAAVSAQLWDLQIGIHRRTKGELTARKIAWQSVRLFLTPFVVRDLLARWQRFRLTFRKKSETNSNGNVCS